MSTEPTPTSRGVALVTGTAQGIGRSIALRLASDGYDIGLNDIEESKYKLDALSEEIISVYPGRKACVVVADVTVEEEVKAMVEGVVAALGSLDVIVANAGILRAAPILETSTTDWDSVLAVNCRGTFLCYKYAAKQMITQGTKGRMVGASSLAGKKGHAFLGAYCASKFALRGLTQTAAIEFGRHGITVNAYAPGAIETTMMDAVYESYAKYTGGETNIYEQMKKTAVVGYLGNTKDVAGLVSYLVSPEAHYITGQTVTIDGGIHFD
ncbi:NAD(P)-binding protein [Gyrodon lividus]|nr:NAD(P)-binding protein [Gyrodon lividus]